MHLGMSMEMRPQLRQEQRKEQRMALEQKLEARLQMQCRQEMRLAQYMMHEDIITGFIRWATKHKSWVNFDKEGFNFKYAALPYCIAQPIADRVGFGFAHCMYNSFEALISGEKVALAQGDWTLFVVTDMIPKNLVDYVAIHERGEELSLGNHYFASQLEFTLPKKNGRLTPYVKFIDEKAPSKFIDLTQEVLFPVLPQELIDFLQSQGKRHPQEMERAEYLIDKYPLPSTVLRLMDKYAGISDKFCELLHKASGETQRNVYQSLLPGKIASPQEVADLISSALTKILTTLEPHEARVVSRAQANKQIREFEEVVLERIYPRIRRHIKIETDFAVAYKKAINGEKLAVVQKTTEDKLYKQEGEIKDYASAIA